jgi:hypothetical protein
MQRMLIALTATAALVFVAACGEKPQALQAGAKKAGSQAYEGAESSSMAAGWKPGDAASWDKQMRTRAQTQNEYARIAQ